MQNTRLDKAQAEIKIVRRNMNNMRYADDTTLMAESKEKLKSLLVKVKEESEKSWLKTKHSKNLNHGIQSHHFMANRWGSSRDIKRRLLLGRKAMTNLNTILKSRHYFGNKDLSSQSYGFTSSRVWM